MSIMIYETENGAKRKLFKTVVQKGILLKCTKLLRSCEE